MKKDTDVQESLPFELSIPRSFNLDTITKEEFEKTLSGTFEEEARGAFQNAEEVFAELRKEPVK